MNDKEKALAAAELIRATDSARELGRVYRSTEMETRRVAAANERYTEARNRPN